MQGHDAIAQALIDQGIDTMFGVLGDGNLFIAEAMMREHGLHYVAATHEANAVLMAEGYAKATGRLGVATVTHGPGLTNTFTALIEAARARTPLLLITGDTPRGAREHLQNLDQHAVVAATGAGFEPIRTLNRIAVDVAIAVRRAHVERRPIVLNVPLDMEWETDVELRSVGQLPVMAQATIPDPAALDVAVGILATATRPLVLAGRGAVRADAHDSLVRLAEALGAPLATSVLGSGYFRGDPFNLGICGTVGTPVALDTIASADTIISFGASLNQFTTDEGALFRDKRVIQCDNDPARIGSTVPIDAGIVGDAASIADTITEWLTQADHRPSGFRSDDLAQRIAEFRLIDSFEDKSVDGAVDPRSFTLRLDEILPEDRTVVLDAGRFMLDALRLPVPDPQSLVTSHAFGAIGLGMSNAIGAATARPDRPTVLLIGDGGFMMGALTEFHTAVEHDLDLIVVLYNDGSYGAEHIQLWNKQMDPAASLHHWPDFQSVMGALGANTVTVSSLADMDHAADAITNRKTGQPVFIEAKLDPAMISAIPR